MKYLPLVIIFLTIIFNSSCQSAHNASVLPKDLYKIKKIKEEKTLYVVYATRNDSTFKIISMKNDITRDCNKIKTGKYYQIDLEQILPVDPAYNASYLEISGMGFPGGVNILVEKKSHYRLYMANNLSGLCISDIGVN
ncbi:MAG: hypothetical protein LBH91_02210 [Prevotellaceae bacterium]|jgi:hypothetical protein|nr:hypothetical protein [Prevotellaceae bacterium]